MYLTSLTPSIISDNVKKALFCVLFNSILAEVPVTDMGINKMQTYILKIHYSVISSFEWPLEASDDH